MTKLTPKIYYENYKEPCQKLDDSICSKDEKNVAISGIFGSGKSSLIQTYEKAFNNKKGKKIVLKYKNLKNEETQNKENNTEAEIELNKALNNLKKKPIKKSLHISLANFNIVNDKQIKQNQLVIDNNQNQEETTIDITESEKIKKGIIELDKYKENRQTITNMDEAEIEKNLLQQFLFNVSVKKLPDSKIKRVDTKHGIKKFAFISFILSLIFISIFAINKFSWLWITNAVVDKVFISLSFVSVILLLSSLVFLFNPKSLKIDKVEISIEDKPCYDDNLLGRFADELIYFFEKTGYEIVYLEDLDRLPNLKIFNKLRELNYLLNNSASIKKKVTFVYCISDSIISDYEERTKFFDKIITLQPFLTQEKVKKQLQEIITKTQNDAVSEFVHDMSTYITESRLFNSIKSDYQEQVKDTENNILNKIKIMTLSVYKNLYYFDYNKLNTKTACLSKCFNLIELTKHEIRDQKQKEIDDLYKQLNDSKIDENAYLKILKERISGILQLEINNRDYVIGNSYGINVININTIEDLKTNNNFHINFGYSISKSKLNKYFYENYGLSFDDAIRNTEVKIEDVRNEIVAKIQKIEKDIKLLNELSISEFMKKFDISLVDNENHFLNVCFKKGYIDSDYMKFVFGENNSYLIEQDDAFVRYNKYFEANSPAKDNFEYKLTNLSEITKQIYSEKFKCKTILNTQLIEYVLYQSTEVEKRQNLINYLNSDDNDVLNFLTAYIKTNNFEKIKQLLLKLGNPETLINAYTSLLGIIDEDKKCLILNFLINEFNLNDLSTANKVLFVRILNNNNLWKSVSIYEKTLLNLKDLPEVKLKNIVNLDIKSLNIIKNTDIFELNYDNILSISKRIFNIEDLSRIFDKLINIDEESDDVNFKRYILSNVLIFLELFKEQVLEESSLKYLLSIDSLEDSTKQKIIEDCIFTVESPCDIEKSYIEAIIENDKLNHNFESVIIVFQSYGEEYIDKYFETKLFEKMSLNITNLKNYEGFDAFIKYVEDKYILSENALTIFNKFDISNITLNVCMDKNYCLNMERLVSANIIEPNATNFNNLVNCYKAYLHLIDKNKDLYIDLLNNSELNLNNDLLTYILCNTQHEDIINKIVNDFPNQISFGFVEDLGTSKINYLSKIWDVVLKCEITNKDILINLSHNIINSIDIKISFMDLIKTNKTLLQNKNETMTIFESIDERFENCRNVGYQFINLDNIVVKGLTILKDMKIINTRKGKNKITITSYEA